MLIIIAWVLLKDFTTEMHGLFPNFKMVWYVLLLPLRPELRPRPLLTFDIPQTAGDHNCRLKGRVFVVKRCCFEV
jgi:hypothetical protein